MFIVGIPSKGRQYNVARVSIVRVLLTLYVLLLFMTRVCVCLCYSESIGGNGGSKIQLTSSIEPPVSRYRAMVSTVHDYMYLYM